MNGAKAGRGSPNKIPFGAAAALNEKGRPTHLKLSPLPAFSRQAIAQWAQAHLSPGTLVSSDGLACLTGVTESGCTHSPFVVGQHKPRELPEFKWVNTILGNLKTSLSRVRITRLNFANTRRCNWTLSLIDSIIALIWLTSSFDFWSRQLRRRPARCELVGRLSFIVNQEGS